MQIVSTIIGIVIIAPFLVPSAPQTEFVPTMNTGGVVFLKPSLKKEPSIVEDFDCDELSLYWEHEGEVVSLLMAEIKFIELLSKTSASVITRDGTILTPSNFYFKRSGYAGTVDTIHGRYQFFNPASQDWEERGKEFRISEIARIEFDSEMGDIKQCPVDSRFFPSEYRFCPFDQVPLLWGSFEESKKPTALVCSKCAQQHFGKRVKYCSFDGTELIAEER